MALLNWTKFPDFCAVNSLDLSTAKIDCKKDEQPHRDMMFQKKCMWLKMKIEKCKQNMSLLFLVHSLEKRRLIIVPNASQSVRPPADTLLECESAQPI